MPHLILFDIDGTLLLTGGAGKVAFNRVFEELYGETEIWQDVTPDGRTDDSLVHEVYQKRFGKIPNPDELSKIAARYNELMAEELPRSERFRLMPFARETLTKLAAQPHVHLGLATGNYEAAAWHKLKHAGLDHHFTFGGFGSDAFDRLKLTQIALERGIQRIGTTPESVYLIGDTIHDVTCGKAIGAKTIAVCTGSTKAEELKEAGADWVLTDLSGLLTSSWFLYK
jgi:phosphoglycolate phosphatase